MKRFLYHYLRTLLLLIATGYFISAKGTTPPTITIDYNGSSLTAGSAITVPIVIDGGTYSIGGFELDINYNTDILTYVNTTDVYSGLTGSGFFASTYVGLSNYKIKITWSGFTGISLINQIICNLHFTYNGSNTALSFYFSGTPASPSASYIADNTFTPIETAVWNDGSASGAPGVITSVAAGGNWNVAGTWDLGHVPNTSNSVVIASPASNPVIIAANATCTYDLTINSTGALTLNSGKTLTVGGNLLLKSDASGAASFVDLGGTLTVTGTTSVQRYMSGNWTGGVPTSTTTWHYISSPIDLATINVFLGDLLNSYDEPLQQWDSLTLPLTIPLQVGMGYAAAPHDPGGTKTFVRYSGIPGNAFNTGNYTLSSLSFTTGGNPSYQGYNLIGNPYPSSLQWDNTWSKTNVDGDAWVWGDSLGTGHYWVNNGTTGTGPFINGIIPPEQGFFVKVTSSGSGSITIPNAKRMHSTQAYYKDALSDIIRLKLEGNHGYDEAVVYFDQSATTGYDNNLDAYKLFSGSPVTEIYTVIGNNTDASINVLPDFKISTVIPVGIKTGATGTYTLTASQLESFPIGTSIYLEDLVTNHIVTLTDNPVYTFTSDAVNTVRFNLLFAPVGIPEAVAGKVSIYSNQKDVYVNVPTSTRGNIVIYNLLGSEVANQAIQPSTLNKISLNSPTGYYIVKVIGDDGITTGKVFIQ